MSELNELKYIGEAPEWYTEEGYSTITGGYLLDGETPRGMYSRVASAAAKGLCIIRPPKGHTQESLSSLFFKCMYTHNWFGPATPILSNLGTDRGLPISCYKIHTPDSIKGITESLSELAAMSKVGGGVGVGFSDIRGRGSLIRGGKNGTSDGIIPFAKMFDSTIIGITQGSRRGAASINLDIEHPDFGDFIKMRRPEGDHNRQCGYLHHCVVISDEFMTKVKSGNTEAREKWADVLKTRIETGEPYIMFKDAVNSNNPKGYITNKLEVDSTNICTEIIQYDDDEHSTTCCLASINLSKYDEWKEFDIPYVVTLFLNGVLNEFISKGQYVWKLDKSVKGALKGRSIGIGAMGWHSLLQQKMIPFESYNAMSLNNEIFKHINDNSLKASKDLCLEYGEVEWTKGTGEYNAHRCAIAPTRSNSTIIGNVSSGIEPFVANAFADKTSKGVFFMRNIELVKLLQSYEKDTDKVWKSISENKGSVSHLNFLTDNEKLVFKTAYEIDQKVIIEQAAQRQKYICQSQSVNLFFDNNVVPSYFNQVHLRAWDLGMKTLYYCKSTSGISADNNNRDDGCKSCEG